MNARIRSTGWIVLVVVVLLCQLPVSIAAQEAEAPSGSDNSGMFVGFSAVYSSGLVVTALVPPDGYGGGMNPMDFGWGLSVVAEYGFEFGLRPFADIGMHRWQKIVALEGEYASSFWVYEQTGYTTHDLGPFDEDAYLYMDTIGARAGLKFGFPLGNFMPWIGAGYGLYTWTATYGNKERDGMWGQDSGEVWGLTTLGGVMINLTPGDPNPALISLFADMMSPVANPVIENLFNDGWTWDNTAGNPVMGPRRFGLIIMM